MEQESGSRQRWAQARGWGQGRAGAHAMPSKQPWEGGESQHFPLMSQLLVNIPSALLTS